MICQILKPLKLEQILHLAAHKQHGFCFCFVICYYTHAWYDTCLIWINFPCWFVLNVPCSLMVYLQPLFFLCKICYYHLRYSVFSLTPSISANCLSNSTSSAVKAWSKPQRNQGTVMQFKVFKERQCLLLDQLLQLEKKQTSFQAHKSFFRSEIAAVLLTPAFLSSETAMVPARFKKCD